MSERVPTEKQYAHLLTLGNGCMIVSGGDRTTRAMVKRGWVTPDLPKWPDNGFRITPAGLRALAQAVEVHGLPDIGPTRPQKGPLPRFREALYEIRRRGCTDCDRIAREALYPEDA